MSKNENHWLLIVFCGLSLQNDAQTDLIFDLELKLHDLVDNSGLGTVDGNEMDMGEAPNSLDMTLFLIGPDVDVLFDFVVPHLKMCPLSKKAYAVKFYGHWLDPDALKKRIQFPNW